MPQRNGLDRARAEAKHGDSDGAGRAIAGRGYYVWDEDPREAAQWAQELGASRAPAPAAEEGARLD